MSERTDDTIDSIRYAAEAWGFIRHPWYVRFWRWLKRIIHLAKLRVGKPV